MAIDIDDMPETPQHRGIHHRRAHSDTSFRFDDFLLFDPSDLDLSSLDLPSPNPTPPRSVPVPLDSSDDSSSNSHGQKQQKQSQNPPKPKPINHLRSLSVDSDFFDSLGLTSPASGGGAGNSAAVGGGGGGDKRSYHRHSNSMDGFEVESILGDGVKKAMDRDRLAELALIDPKRAKRFAFSSTSSLFRLHRLMNLYLFVFVCHLCERKKKKNYFVCVNIYLPLVKLTFGSGYKIVLMG